MVFWGQLKQQRQFVGQRLEQQLGQQFFILRQRLRFGQLGRQFRQQLGFGRQ